MGENCSYYFLVIGDILVFCFLCFCYHEPDWFYSGGCWILPILRKTVSALYLILRWPLRHLGFYDMFLIVNRLIIKEFFVFFFALMLFAGVLLYYSPFYNRYCLRPFLQKYKSGFLSWIHIHRCFRSSKALKNICYQRHGWYFLALYFYIKPYIWKTKQNKTKPVIKNAFCLVKFELI